MSYSVSHEFPLSGLRVCMLPTKVGVVFEESAHMMFQEQPGRFLEHLLTDVRPFAVRVGDAAPDEEMVTDGKAKKVSDTDLAR